MRTEIVKNNWKSRKDVIILDIETNWSKDWSEQGKRNRRFICGVIYSYNENKFLSFTDSDKFVEKVNKAKKIVSYNGEGFDFLVIAKFGIKLKALDLDNRWEIVNKVSMDIMHTIQENRKNQKNKYPKLEEMMEVNLGKKKTEYNHNDIKQVIKHCKEDVEYTKKLYELKEWKVPIIRRSTRKPTSNGVWENDYDRDCYEAGSVLLVGLNCPKCGGNNFDEFETIDSEWVDDEMKPFECYDCGAVFDYDNGVFLE